MMRARLLPAGLIALALLACNGNPPTFSGRPHIAGTTPHASTKITTAASAAPSAAASVAPSSLPLPSQEPPPVPITRTSQAPVGTGGTGGTGTTPAADASPALSLVSGAQPANTWQLAVPMQRPRAGLVAGALGTRLYALEGEHAPSLESWALGETAWTIDTSYDMAGLAPDFNVALRNGRSLLTIGIAGNALYTAGGTNGLGPQDELVRYLDTGPDGDVPVMSVKAKACAGGLAGDIFVVAGGLDDTGAIINSTQRLDVTVPSGAFGAAMPLAVAGAAGAAIGTKVYVVGGYTLAGSTPTAQTAVQVYDVTSNAWRRDGDGGTTPPAPLPEARHSAAAAVLNGKLYVAGGIGANGAPLGTIAVYDPTANTWTTKASMAVPRALLALAPFQGRLWALGGFDATGKLLASVEVYKP